MLEREYTPEEIDRIRRKIPHPEKWVLKEEKNILPVEQCKNCACRFSVHLNKKGEMVAREEVPFDAWNCSAYLGFACGPFKAENKPAELFQEEGTFKCPAYQNLLDKMKQWAVHVPNWFNDGELPIEDD